LFNKKKLVEFIDIKNIDFERYACTMEL